MVSRSNEKAAAPITKIDAAAALEPDSVSAGNRAAREAPAALEFAARSVLESQAITGTVASVVQERALDHHFHGLFQYAAIRLGPETAAPLLAKLEVEAERLLHAEAAADHSPQARLYAWLRQQLRAQRLSYLPAESALWWSPSAPAYRAQLLELRQLLDEPLAELAELCFARRLRPAEIAYVLDLSTEEVVRRLNEVDARATSIFGRRPNSRDRSPPGAILEAFSLDAARIAIPKRRRPPVLELGALLANRYEIEELLGTGSFSDVYRARDREVTDHVVALKILRRQSKDERSVESAMRELQLIASVFHPSVVQLKDHGWHAGHLWFVMPLYQGETLAQRLLRGPLTRREAREIFEPLAEALATMHRAGVRHQDVKPENVFLASLDPDAPSGDASRRLLPVLLDLGVAAKDAELVLAGTPAYFAPEVAARFAGIPDPAPVGSKADVFSLALTLCHALAPGLRTRISQDAVDAFVALRGKSTPFIPDTPELRDLQAQFARWLAFSPDDRPTAEEFRRELAFLTRREELKKRRWATLRWTVPSAVAVLALFGSVIYILSREAALQRLHARDARSRADHEQKRAASLYASYTVEEARRRELEADVHRLDREYQTSRMSRDELASRLAHREGELAILNEREKALSARARQLFEAESALRSERDSLLDANARLLRERDDTLQELERHRSRRAAAEGELEALRQQLRARQQTEEQLEARIRELEQRLASRRAGSVPEQTPPNRHRVGPDL